MHIPVEEVKQYKNILEEYLYLTQDDKPAIGLKAIYAIINAYESNRHGKPVIASEQRSDFANGAVAGGKIKDFIEQLNKIKKLTTEEQLILMMYYYNKLTMQEIAQIFCAPMIDVTLIWHNAIVKIR